MHPTAFFCPQFRLCIFPQTVKSVIVCLLLLPGFYSWTPPCSSRLFYHQFLPFQICIPFGLNSLFMFERKQLRFVQHIDLLCSTLCAVLFSIANSSIDSTSRTGIGFFPSQPKTLWTFVYVCVHQHIWPPLLTFVYTPLCLPIILQSFIGLASMFVHFF